MNLIVNNLLIPIEKDGEDEYLQAAALKLGADSGLSVVKILSKAIDLSDLEQFYVTSPKLVVKSKKKSCVPTLDRLTCLA